MTNPFRFIYLNLYAFFLLSAGIINLGIPYSKKAGFLTVIQIIITIFFIYNSAKLFSTWKDKKIKYSILMGKNKTEFRSDTFQVFMQAPCGRLLVKAVLKDLNRKEEYKNLLKFKPPVLQSIKNNCVQQETRIYINEDI